jgi:hypothetical protein
MKRIVPFLLIVVAVAVAVCLEWAYPATSFASNRSDGVAEQRVLPPFTRIVVTGFADVTLVQGGAESVIVEGGARPGVQADVSDGTLTIAGSQSRHWWSWPFGGGARPARLKVTFRALDAISAAGSVKLRADRLSADRLAVSASGATSLRIADLDAKELSVGGAGAMKAELAGRTVTQKVAISGAGDYRAAGLASEDAWVTVSGAGRVVVRAEKTLRIVLSGAGSVEYLGDPEVTQEITGIGRVSRRAAAFTPAPIAQASVLPPRGP